MLNPCTKNRASPSTEVRLDSVGIEMALDEVGCEDDDEIGLFTYLVRRHHPQPLGLGLGTALRPLRQPDPHVDTGIAQAQRVGVSLAAVAQYGDVAGLDSDRSASSS